MKLKLIKIEIKRKTVVSGFNEVITVYLFIFYYQNTPRTKGINKIDFI